VSATASAGVPRRVLSSTRAWLAEAWRQIRAWRRIYFTGFGLAFTLGTVAVGFAAMNTANNLLYLLLGSMIGFISVSSWLSEQAIRDVGVERRVPRSATVGQDFRLTYEVTNHKRLLPSLAIELVETGLPNRAFVAHLGGRKTGSARSVNSFVRRGIYPLRTVTLSTSFPFGLFRKERDVELPAEVVVWPRTDRPVREPVTGGGRSQRTGVMARGAPGARGEYRSLRGYRPGDDPRDIHWRSSARSANPVVREYEADGAETRWICLDTRESPDEPAEVAVEVTAALLAAAATEQRAFALVAGDVVLAPGHGVAHMERALDILARVDFDPSNPAPAPPVPPSACILVAVRANAVGGSGAVGGPVDQWGDVLAVGTDARLAASPVTAAA
jgi:uncharacterized protein (DUF58 family)